MGKIGIIGAMDIEVDQLIASMSQTAVTQCAGRSFCEGIFDGQRVVVVRSGIGKVNAAICTQILQDLFHVKAIINTGAAGSLDAHINIGDIVLSTDAVYHDVNAAQFGYAIGQVPQMKVTSFPTSSKLLERAELICRRILPDVGLWKGRIASGDQFISNEEQKSRIRNQFQALCTEMEGAAIAHTCYCNEIPCLIIRSISDKADGSDSMDYPEFEIAAASRSLKLVQALLREWPD